MKVYEYPERNIWPQLLSRPTHEASHLNAVVAEVLADVKARGDQAVREYEERFDKVCLGAGESCRVTLTLNKRSFAYYNPTTHDWFVENGDFKIMVGASSRDIRLIKKIRIDLPEEDQFSR